MLKIQNLTLDFETYYDDEFSLKLMTTADYIHDSRFKIHGLGYKFENNESYYLCDPITINEFLSSIDWNHTRLIGHNLIFDAYILAIHFNIFAHINTDTCYMAKAALPTLKYHSLFFVSKYLELGTKDLGVLPKVKGKRNLTPEEQIALGIYCKSDCDKSWGIYDRLFGFIAEQEFELMSMTTRMMLNPQFKLNDKVLEKFIKELKEERKKLIKASGVSITTLRSTAKMIKALKPYEVKIPMKPAPKPPEDDPHKMIPTFEKDHPDIADLLVDPQPEVRRIIRARLNVMSSLRLNRAERFLAVSKATGGFLPVPLGYCSAHTGRWGGLDKLNLQNVPVGPLRESIIAPPHHQILWVDFGQIEARITAWLAEHFALLEKFGDPNIDVYIEFAAEYYGKSIKEIFALGKKSKPRFVGKTCTLGLGFGMGWKKLRHEFLTKHAWTKIVLSKEEAYRAVSLYRRINYPIKQFWDFLNAIVIPRIASAAPGTEYGHKCFQYGKDYIRLPSGRSLIYPNLRAEDGEWPDGEPKIDWVYDYKGGKGKLYGGKLTENLAQALARDLNADTMLKIDKVYPIATMTHDENVVVPHNAEVEEARKFMIDVMSTPPDWAPDLPLTAEGEYNVRYTE